MMMKNGSIDMGNLIILIFVIKFNYIKNDLIF